MERSYEFKRLEMKGVNDSILSKLEDNNVSYDDIDRMLSELLAEKAGLTREESFELYHGLLKSMEPDDIPLPVDYMLHTYSDVYYQKAVDAKALNGKLKVLGFPNVFRRALLEKQVSELSAVLKMTDSEILRIRGIGPYTLKKIRSILSEIKYS